MKINNMIALNCLGPYPFGYYLNAYDLLMFSLGSFVLISILLLYYNKIPKSNFNENDIQLERKTSRWPKVLFYLLIIIPIIIQFVEFFNFGNLFTNFDVFMLSSLVTLLLYLNITSKVKRVVYKKTLNNPLYQTKDILLHSKSNEASFVIPENTTSSFVRILAFILIIFIAITPFQEFLGDSFF